jgi:hypothetical protein
MNHQHAGWRQWVPAGVGAGLIIGTVLLLFRVPQVSTKPRTTEQSTQITKVELAPKGDALLREEAELKDPTPLFLPTRWNAGDDALMMNAPREPGGSFQDYPPELTFGESQLKLEIPAHFELPSRPVDTFALEETNRALPGFGRTDAKIVQLPTRQGFIEVSAAGTGQVMIRQPILDEKPTTDVTWQPLEFVIALDVAGVVGPPALTESSRVPAIDSFFREYVVKRLHIGERLEPGFYRISIGP